MAKDRFHEYLDYCENVEPISVGDYIELVKAGNETLAWTKLMVDIHDTHNAGRLKKVKLENGGAAYVRKTSSHSSHTNTHTIP